LPVPDSNAALHERLRAFHLPFEWPNRTDAGPGRHKFGSNWFWYFNSPLACHVEYDADMDLHDDSWVAREAPMGADASQLFLFQHREKWAPGPPPPGAAGGAPAH
jgi:hypothetical protein